MKAEIEERVLLLRCLKNHKLIIIYNLIRDSEQDISELEIVEYTSISQKTVHKFVIMLLENKLIEITRKIGKTNFYKKAHKSTTKPKKASGHNKR